MTKLRLTVDVVYDEKGTSVGSLMSRLYNVAMDAAGNGMFTGSSSAEVESWDSKVEVVET